MNLLGLSLTILGHFMEPAAGTSGSDKSQARHLPHMKSNFHCLAASVRHACSYFGEELYNYSAPLAAVTLCSSRSVLFLMVS